MKPDNGYFGQFGGMFIPEILHEVFRDLEAAYESLDADFYAEYKAELSSFSCRPTPLMLARNLTRYFGGPKIYIKREDLNHTGAHKLNNVVGQGLLVQRIGKTRVIAETGAGQHGIATATMAARFGFDCTIYMGAKDVLRQRPNVFWMEKLGAKVVSVTDGGGILKDAINAAMKDLVTNFQNTHYVLGTACGPHPYPQMVADFQNVIGKEAQRQILELESRQPTAVYACVGGGSNAIGIFQGFLDSDVQLIGVEAGGKGLNTDKHAARLAGGGACPGVAQGYKTYFLQNNDGQLSETHSIAAGLDYVGVSPIMSHLHDTGRVRFEAATDDDVIEAHKLVMEKEGIIPALESAHAFAQAFKEISRYSADDIIIINQSGRGDKDIFTIADAYQDKDWEDFIIKKADSYAQTRKKHT